MIRFILALGLVLSGWTPAYAARCFPRHSNEITTRAPCCCDGSSSAAAPCRATSCRREPPSVSVTAEAPRPAPTMSASHVLAALVPAPFDPRLNLLHRETDSRSSPAPPARRYLLTCAFRL